MNLFYAYTFIFIIRNYIIFIFIVIFFILIITVYLHDNVILGLMSLKLS